jgi:nucleoside-diphosphate-sugar epimerase
MQAKLKCGITGARGFLGSRLANQFERSGYEVIELVRGAGSGSRAVVPWQFGKDQIPAGLDLLIHCAWDFKATTREEIQHINVEGSIALLKAARSAGTRNLIFISSTSAYAECTSLYGGAKLQVEKAARELGALVVRPGLIYGDGAGGIVGMLTKAVKALPIVPVIGSGNQKFVTVHIDDLCVAIEKLAREPALSNPDFPVAANEAPVTLIEILRSIAVSSGASRWFLPIPWVLPYVFLRALELVGIKPPFRSDSLLSLIRLDPKPAINPAWKEKKVFRAFHPAKKGSI